ncbi:hypothetical protein NDU88_004378 [Pleurodeles waltl]|uniref:Uncharacterized protein n=1 Tax=Pleurodeles waltl TaxID=8319 RepID=A0AAV7TR58_PLEWA|nr:hypothetical protein NDU88_004378 [Pleurodeles waltl]
MRIRVLARDCLPKKAEGTTERSSAEGVSAWNPQRFSPLRSAYGRYIIVSLHCCSVKTRAGTFQARAEREFFTKESRRNNRGVKRRGSERAESPARLTSSLSVPVPARV